MSDTISCFMFFEILDKQERTIIPLRLTLRPSSPSSELPHNYRQSKLAKLSKAGDKDQQDRNMYAHCSRKRAAKALDHTMPTHNHRLKRRSHDRRIGKKRAGNVSRCLPDFTTGERGTGAQHCRLPLSSQIAPLKCTTMVLPAMMLIIC